VHIYQTAAFDKFDILLLLVPFGFLMREGANILLSPILFPHETGIWGGGWVVWPDVVSAAVQTASSLLSYGAGRLHSKQVHPLCHSYTAIIWFLLLFFFHKALRIPVTRHCFLITYSVNHRAK
jgi:hypothetical protein